MASARPADRLRGQRVMSDPVSTFADDLEALLPKVAELSERGRKIAELRARKGDRLGKVSRTEADFAADRLQALLHLAEEHVGAAWEEVDAAATRVYEAADGLSEIRQSLKASASTSFWEIPTRPLHNSSPTSF